MTIRVYSSLDAGAPALTGTYYNKVRTILDACLVYGYGSKPAAGWIITHSHAEGVAYSNGEGNAYFAYQDSKRTLAGIIEVITGSSAKVPSGENLSLLADGLGEGGGALDSSDPHWVVVADDKTCMLMYGSGFSGADSNWYNSGAQAMPLYFGRYINALGLTPAFCMLGWTETMSPWTGRIGAASDGVAGKVLRNPFTGLLDQGTSPRFAVGLATPNGAFISRSHTQQQSRLMPVRPPIVGFGAGISGGTSRASARSVGWPRGLITEPSLNTLLLSKVLEMFSKPNTWQSRVQPIEVAPGKLWVPFYSGLRDVGFFISLDPADWE